MIHVLHIILMRLDLMLGIVKEKWFSVRAPLLVASLFLCLTLPFSASAQQNCYWYLHIGDTLKHKACIASEKISGHYQFSKEFQTVLDDALVIDSTYAPAYRSKSVAYLKSGDFVTWNYLMGQAVRYDSMANLGDRGWCRFKFFADYNGAINDLQEFQKLSGGQLNEVSGDGYYRLDVVLSLCYKSIGRTEEALTILKEKTAGSPADIGLFDYLHLGVLYLELGEFQNAIDQFQLQEATNDLAENRFYKAIAYKYIGNQEAYIENLNMCKRLYHTEQRLFDPYVEMTDKIYLSDIILEEKNGLQQQLPTSSGYVLRRAGK